MDLAIGFCTGTLLGACCLVALGVSLRRRIRALETELAETEQEACEAVEEISKRRRCWQRKAQGRKRTAKRLLEEVKELREEDDDWWEKEYWWGDDTPVDGDT